MEGKKSYPRFTVSSEHIACPPYYTRLNAVWCVGPMAASLLLRQMQLLSIVLCSSVSLLLKASFSLFIYPICDLFCKFISIILDLSFLFTYCAFPSKSLTISPRSVHQHYSTYSPMALSRTERKLAGLNQYQRHLHVEVCKKGQKTRIYMKQ